MARRCLTSAGSRPRSWSRCSCHADHRRVPRLADRRDRRDRQGGGGPVMSAGGMPWSSVLPEIVLVVGALAILLFALFAPRRSQRFAAHLSLLVLAASAASTWLPVGAAGPTTFFGTYAIEGPPCGGSSSSWPPRPSRCSSRTSGSRPTRAAASSTACCSCRRWAPYFWREPRISWRWCSACC